MTDLPTLDVRTLPSTRETIAYKDGGLFPVLVVGPRNKLVAAVRGGAGHLGLAGRIDMIRSDDGGWSWTPPDVIADSERDDRNPALGVARSGALVLVYRREGRYDAGGALDYGHLYPPDPDARPTDVMVTRSHDGGLTWERPAPIELPGIRSGSPFGKIATLTDGTLALAIYDVYQPRESGETVAEHMHSYLVRSRDDGVTWDDPSPIAAMTGETSLLALPNGDLLALLRDHRLLGPAPALSSARSSDGGYTWSAPVRVTEPSQHPADLILLGDGSVLLTYGSRRPPYRIEGRVSRDGGASWLPVRLFLSGPLHGYNVAEERPYDFGYPSSAILRENGSSAGVTLYYHNPSVRTPRAERGPGSEIYQSRDYVARAVLWSETELLDAVQQAIGG